MKISGILLLLAGLVLCVTVQADEPFEYEISGSVYSVHVADGFIAAGSENKNVYLFDGEGNLKWKREADGPVENVYISDGYVVAASFKTVSEDLHRAEDDPGTIIAGTESADSHIYLFDMEGNKKWEYKTRGGVDAVHIFNNYVAGVTFKGHVYLFDIKGNKKWEFKNYGSPFDCANGFHSVQISKDVVVVGSDDVCGSDSGFLYFLDINNGNLLKERKTGDVVWDVYSVDNYTAAGSQDSYVYLFDNNGYLKWRKKTKAGVNSVKIYKNYVAAGSFDGNVYLFDINSGKELWKHKEGNYPNEHVKSVDISDEGILVGTWFFTYLLDFDGKLKWKWVNPEGGSAVVSMGENYMASGIETGIEAAGFVNIFEAGKTYKNPISKLNLIILGGAVLGLLALVGAVYYLSKKNKKRKRRF